MPTDILIYAFIAGVLIVWLRNILGTKHGDERQRDNPFSNADDKTTENRGRVVDIVDAPNTLPGLHDAAAPLKDIVIRNPQAEEGLLELMRLSRDFDPKKFIMNAKDAFAMVVESFAAGDRRMLRDLLAPSVLRDFEQVIDERQAREEKVVTEVHAVRRAEILDVRIYGKMAYITIRFTADETCVIRDKEDKIIVGNPDRVTEMVDVWTFGKDIKSRDPIWLVYETRDDTPEIHKTPMPESGHIQ